MSHRHATQYDPRGMIAEAYQIEGLDDAQARAIFLDWAMMDAGDDCYGAMKILHQLYGESNPHHPMSQLLAETKPDNTIQKKRRRKRR